MRKIRIITRISVDGVIQAPSGPQEDASDGFKYGGWATPYADPAAGEAIAAGQGKSFDLLLGRRTYDMFSNYWPTARNPFADGLNAATKYVATHRPDSLGGWKPVEAVGPDIVEGVRRIKAKKDDGRDLIVWGSSTLTPVLLEHGIADEVLLLVVPVLLGTGKRLFSEGAAPRGLALVSTKATPSGVVISTYRNSGPLRTGTFGE